MYWFDSGGLYTFFCGFIFHGKVSILPIFSLSISEYVDDLLFIFPFSSSSVSSYVYGAIYSLGIHVLLFILP